MTVFFLGSNGSLQSDISGNTSLLIDADNNLILVDVSGAPSQSIRKAGYDPINLSAVVLTHSHVDHLYALPSLLHNLWLLKRSQPLRIIGNTKTLECAQALCNVFGLLQKKGMFPIRWDICDNKSIQLSEMFVHLFRVNHNVPTCGLVCTDTDFRLAYTADTGFLDTIPAQMYNADLLIHEAGGLASDETGLAAAGHSSARQAAQTALKANAKQLILCHLPLSPVVQQNMLTEAAAVFPNTSLPLLFTQYKGRLPDKSFFSEKNRP